VEDPLWHAEARFAGCGALAWIGSEKTMKKVAEHIVKFAGDKDPKKQLHRSVLREHAHQAAHA